MAGKHFAHIRSIHQHATQGPARRLASRGVGMKGNTIPAMMIATAYALLRLPEVRRRCGLSRSEIYRRCAADPPTFPRPVKLGEHASGWVAGEIAAWVADRIAARDAKAAA